jgi:uncharacterized protein (DUF4415 family)
MRRKSEKPNTESKPQDKITLYIDKDVIKEFKKLAIDEERGFSELAQKAFEAYIKNHKKPS